MQSSRLCAWLVLSLSCLGTWVGCGGKAGSLTDDPGRTGPDGCACGQNEMRCNEEYLLSCDCEGWRLVEPCGTADRCDSRAGTCRACDPGQLRCNGREREACSEAGFWETVQVCSTEARCNPTICDLCPTPGEVGCAMNGDDDSVVLRQCVQSTGWEIIDDCASERLCELTVDAAMRDPDRWMGECFEPVCPEPGALDCDGARLVRCTAGLDEWARVDVCDSEELCEQTVSENSGASAALVEECNAGCAPPGGFVCDGRDLMRCRDDQTDWETVETCASGLTCDAARGGCNDGCTAGEYRCSGADLEVCNDDRTWELTDECDTAALCVALQDLETLEWFGLCEFGPCGANDHECRGPELWRCSEDQTAWVLDDVCATPELCESGLSDQACAPPVCGGTLPDYRCNGSLLERCNTSQTAWEVVMDCGEAPCDAGENGDGPGQCVAQ